MADGRWPISGARELCPDARRQGMHSAEQRGAARHRRRRTGLGLFFALCCFSFVVAQPLLAWCDSGIFYKSGASSAFSDWRSEGKAVSRLGSEVHPYMPGAALSELARLESAAAWRQLRDKTDEVLAMPGLSGQERGWAHIYRAWSALGENDLPVAQADAAAARRLLPRAVQPVLLLCIVEARQGKPRKAEAYLKAHSQRGAPATEGYAALAAFYQDLGDWVSAGHWYAEGLRQEPNSARLNANLAVVLWRLGEARKAFGFMDRAVQLSPGNADFLNERGMMWLGAGQPKQALADFNAALALDGRHCGALLNRGNLFLYGGRPQLAEGDFSLGLRIYSRDVGLLTSRARVYASLGRYDEAQRDLETAFGLAEKDARVLNDFAWFLATCPDNRYWNGPAAIELANAAIANDKMDDAGLYDTLAAAQARAGAFKEAVAAQDEALLKGRKQGAPPEALAEWENRLRLYLKGEAYAQNSP